jgi:multiple sugar transport system permease protein
LPVFALLIFVVFIPIGWAIFQSLFRQSTIGTTKTFIGLGHYAELIFHDSAFWKGVFRSAYFALGSTFLQIALALPTALLLNKKLKGIVSVRALALLPYLLPTIVIGMMFLWILHPQLGVASNLLQTVGLAGEPISFFGSEEIAMPSIIIVNSWKYAPFFTMLFLARLQSIPENHYETAKMCGANSYELFRDITLPYLRSVILLALLLRGIWMFNKFDIIWILTRGGPADATTTLPIYIYEVAFRNYEMGQALAASTLLFGFLLVGGVTYLHYFKPSQEVEA